MADRTNNQTLAKISEMVEVVKTNKKGFGYMYVTDDELLAKITVGMKKYHLSLIPQIVPGTAQVVPYRYTKERTDKNGKVIPDTKTEVWEVLTSCDMCFLWVNDDNPEERVEVPWSMAGMQADASQSFGSGLTYAYRYFLLKYFGIATPDDDPDKWRSKQRAAENEAEQRGKAESQKELAAKRKEITALGQKIIGQQIMTGPALRKLIESYNHAGGAPGDIEEIEIANTVLQTLQTVLETQAAKEETTI